MNLNNMRELKNVVERLASDLSMLSLCEKEARRNLDIKLHNVGIDVVNSRLNISSIQETNAAVYVHDLICAIQSYVEDGNSSTFTIGSGRYPNAETFDWNEMGLYEENL